MLQNCWMAATMRQPPDLLDGWSIAWLIACKGWNTGAPWGGGLQLSSRPQPPRRGPGGPEGGGGRKWSPLWGIFEVPVSF